PQSITLALPDAWGGDLRCAAGACLLGAVEHENSKVVLLRLKGRGAERLDEQAVAYHPDSAAWLSGELLAAAVENSASLDIFRTSGDRLAPVQQLPVGFAPRDVIVVPAAEGQYRLLATPYRGKQVAWIDWREGAPAPQPRMAAWCEAPWHPTLVSRLPGRKGGGIAAACLDDKQVVAVSESDWYAAPKVLASFDAIPRQARPSPSGAWLYVALETGGRNARIDMQTGELQWIKAPPTGSVAVAPLADDLVIWADDQRLTLQRLDAQAQVLETRSLRTSGFSTSVQLHDIDGDGALDALVLNSAGKRSDVIYGPLWQQAQPQP
ncbi:MAG TPA: VCBS repeat-containing protein, partial [Alicycliphilus sp.]|nr:VCBS repeat-containing protein [Alicycliphilus sp.]